MILGRRPDPIREAQALLEQRRKAPHRWYPLTEEEKQAIRLLQTARK